MDAVLAEKRFRQTDPVVDFVGGLWRKTLKSNRDIQKKHDPYFGWLGPKEAWGEIGSKSSWGIGHGEMKCQEQPKNPKKQQNVAPAFQDYLFDDLS